MATTTYPAKNSLSDDDNSADIFFRKALKYSFSFYLLLALVMGLTHLPEPKKVELKALSERVAKLIMEAPDPTTTARLPEKIEPSSPPIPKKKTKEKPENKVESVDLQKPKSKKNIIKKKKPTDKIRVTRDNLKNKPPVTQPSSKPKRVSVRKTGLLASLIEEEDSGELGKIIDNNRMDQALSQSQLIAAPSSKSRKSRGRLVKKTKIRKSGLADKQIQKIDSTQNNKGLQLAKREKVSPEDFAGIAGNGIESEGFGQQSHGLGDGVGIRLNRGGSGSKNIDYDAIARVVEKYKGGLVYLYNKALRLNPTLKGTIVVEFSIDEHGKVLEATVTSSTMEHAKLEKSLARRIQRWKFPKLYNGIIVVTYPFVFFPV